MKKSFQLLFIYSLVLSVVLFTSAYLIVVSKVVAVTPLKMNILYVGYENPISVVASGVDSKNLVLKGSYGTSIRPDTAAGKYFVHANEIGSATITVSAKSDQGTKVIATQTFRVKNAPDPVVYFGTKKGNALVENDELTSPSGLVCKMENFDFDCVFYIQSFVMSINHNGEWSDYTSTSAELSGDMKTEISNATSGTRIFFHDVNVKGSDGVVRNLMGVNLTVR